MWIDTILYVREERSMYTYMRRSTCTCIYIYILYMHIYLFIYGMHIFSMYFDIFEGIAGKMRPKYIHFSIFYAHLLISPLYVYI